MREARSANAPVEKRAGDYLQAAAITAPLLGTGIGTPACETYNAACGELTVLLRSSEEGRLWNHPITLTASDQTYHLRLEPAGNAVWSPDYFTSFVPSAEIKEKLVKKQTTRKAWAASLVGVRNVTPPENFCRPERNSRSRHSHARFQKNGRYFGAAASCSDNRPPWLKEKLVRSLPISPHPSVTTNRRVISCSWH